MQAAGTERWQTPVQGSLVAPFKVSQTAMVPLPRAKLCARTRGQRGSS